MSGTLQQQLTSGNWDVTDLLAVDEQLQMVYYQAADEQPMQRNIYRVNIAKPVPQKLSQQMGHNNATFSNNGKFYVNNWSDYNTPTLITLHSGDGKQVRVLEDNRAIKEALAAAQLPKREAIKVKAADGITDLNGW